MGQLSCGAIVPDNWKGLKWVYDMAFAPTGLTQKLIEELIGFQNQHDFVTLYKSYSWRNDTYENGFPDILSLEELLLECDRNGGISLQAVRQVAQWGKLRNPARIEGKAIVLPQRTLHETGTISSHALAFNPIEPIRLLESNIDKGIGPTYFSKVLRFALPREYGAIDTRCVRVFGEGDHLSQQHRWLNLRARNDGYGWYISTQKAWPSSYGMWVNILRFFSQQLSANCPHPPAFIQSGLRLQNEWACADVEMALFTYASQFTT